jgi:hypothetical protein
MVMYVPQIQQIEVLSISRATFDARSRMRKALYADFRSASNLRLLCLDKRLNTSNNLMRRHAQNLTYDERSQVE